MKFLYVGFNVAIILSIIVASIFRKNLKLPQVLPTVCALITILELGVFFDVVVVGKFWSFSYDKTLGFSLFNIPFEEYLFFLTVPYICLLLWVYLQQSITSQLIVKKTVGCWGIIMFLFIGWLAMLHQTYYLSIVMVCIACICILQFLFNNFLVLQKNYLVFTGIVLVLTCMSDWYLTAQKIIVYNPAVLIGVHILTIPLEDFIYSILMVLITVFIYETVKKIL